MASIYMYPTSTRISDACIHNTIAVWKQVWCIKTYACNFLYIMWQSVLRKHWRMFFCLLGLFCGAFLSVSQDDSLRFKCFSSQLKLGNAVIMKRRTDLCERSQDTVRKSAHANKIQRKEADHFPAPILWWRLLNVLSRLWYVQHLYTLS